MAVSPKFKKVTKTLDRVVSAARVEQQARDALVEQVRADHAEFLDRERRRCHLVGSWILTKLPAWFAASARQDALVKWLKADRRLKREASLFGPDADSDLLTPDKAVAMAEDAGLGSLAGGLREALEDVHFDSAAVAVSPLPSTLRSSEPGSGTVSGPSAPEGARSREASGDGAAEAGPSAPAASGTASPTSSADSADAASFAAPDSAGEKGGGAPPDTAAA